MKKNIVLLISLFMCLSLAACAKKVETTTVEGEAEGYGGIITAKVTLEGDKIVGLEDAVNKRTGLAGGTCGLAIGYLSDGKGLAVTLLDFCAYTNHTTTLTVIILAHIDTAARREVGIEMELLAMEIRDGSIADFSQVVRKNLTVESPTLISSPLTMSLFNSIL